MSTPPELLERLRRIDRDDTFRVVNTPPGVAESLPPDAAARTLQFMAAPEFASQVSESVQWIAAHWIAANAITELSGKIKAAGKTTWVLALCQAVATGRRFMGQPVTRGPVVYLSEQPAASFRQAMRRAGLLACENFYLLQWHQTSGMAWPEVVAQTRRFAHDVGAVLLVVDTLSQFAGIRGDAENNAGAALQAIEPLQLALADGLGILIVRHDRKAGGEVGDSSRGSSAFAGAVDIVLQLQRPQGNARPTIRVVNALSRFDETPDQLAIELKDGEYVVLGDANAIAEAEARAAMLATLPESEGTAATEADLLAELKKSEIKRTTAQEALRFLVEQGQAQRRGAGKRGDPFRYWKGAPGAHQQAAPFLSAEMTGVPAESNDDGAGDSEEVLF